MASRNNHIFQIRMTRRTLLPNSLSIIVLAATFGGIALLSAACRDEQWPGGKGENTTVRLVPTHEAVTIGEQGYSQVGLRSGAATGTGEAAAPADLYAVQVYSKSHSGTGLYSKYAYGLFDDPAHIELELVTGLYYKIEVTQVCGGKEAIARTAEGSYRQPFLLSVSGTASINNALIPSTSDYFTGLGYGVSSVPAAGSTYRSYTRPFADRYHAVVEDYSPAAGNADLQIELKVVTFGVRFTAESFISGTLKIEMTGSPDIVLTAGTDTGAVRTVTFENVADACRNSTYSEAVPVAITWTRGDGVKFELLKKNTPVTFTRNRTQPIRINLAQAAQSGGMSLTHEPHDTSEAPEIVVGED